jgi:Flp pilus assembly pilin Flp
VEVAVVLANPFTKNQKGQVILEYSLIIAVFGMVVVMALSMVPDPVHSVFARLGVFLDDPLITVIETEDVPDPPPLTSLGNTLPEISGNMIDKILAYQETHNNKYPSGSGDKAYTDLGLDPAEWKNIAYNGVVYKPGGSKLTIYPATGYNFSIIDKNGKKIVISKTTVGLVYSIPYSNTWHYKTASGTIVDIDTLEVTKNVP